MFAYVSAEPLAADEQNILAYLLSESRQVLTFLQKLKD